MNTTSSMYHRYFVYSAEEEELQIKVHGKDVSFGTVSVRGIPKRYTSIVRDPNDSKPDAIVLISGDIRKIKYTPPQKNKLQ